MRAVFREGSFSQTTFFISNNINVINFSVVIVCCCCLCCLSSRKADGLLDGSIAG